MTILIPLEGKAILKAEKPAEQTEKGLIIPDSVKKQKSEAVVVAINDVRGYHANGNRMLSQLQKGDRVIFTPHGAHEIEFEGEKLLVVNQEAILVKISPDGHA